MVGICGILIISVFSFLVTVCVNNLSEFLLNLPDVSEHLLVHRNGEIITKSK